VPRRDAPTLSEGTAERRRVFSLVLILATVVLGVAALSIHFLYSAALSEERERLLETASSQARLIEAVARHDVAGLGPGEAALQATLTQVIDAHEQYEGFGNTGEFTLARLVDDQIVFLLRHRHLDLDTPEPVPFDSELAEPMRRALQGESGTLIGLDYRGVRVLAAHEPVAELGLGIVAKIDLVEVRRPFVGAALYGIGPAFAAILLAAWVFSRVTRPIVRRIGETEQRYRDLVETMTDGLSVQDANRMMIYVNDRFCEIVGRTRDELIGSRSDEFLTPESRDEFARQMADRERGSSESHQVAFVRSDGSRVDALLSPKSIFTPRGRFAGSFAVVSDITALKRVENELRREKELAQQYLDLAGVIFVLLGRDGRIELINRRGLDILGYDASDELIGRHWFETCIPESDRQKTREVFEAIYHGSYELSEFHENSVLTKDGDTRLIWWHSTLIEDEAGEFAGILASGEDVTERRRAEERFRLAAEVASDLIYEWDLQSDRLRWFGDIDETLGYPSGTIPATIEAWIGLIHPDDARRLEGAVERHRTSLSPIHEDYRVRHRDGTWRHWIDRGTPILDDQGRIERWIGACVDVTELKESQETLERRATQLETVREIASRISSILDLDRLLDDVVRTIRERFGYYHVDFFLIEGEHAVFRAGSSPAVSAAWHEQGLRFAIGQEGMIGHVAKTGVPLQTGDVTDEPHFLPDELLPDTKSELVVPIFHEGHVIAVLDIQSDRSDAFQPDDLPVMTALAGQLGTAIMNARLYAEVQRELEDRKQAERALRQSEQQYRSLFDNAVLGIYKTTPEGRILAANPALVRILGYDSLDELKQRDLESKGYEAGYPRAEFKARMEREGMVVGYVSGWTRRDGKAVYVRENAKAIRDKTGRILFYEGTIEDITEQREAERAKEALEAQLIHNQKLESIGTLASGVAHEINNPLTGIINYAQLIQDRVDDESLEGFAAGIIREGNRVATIVKNLLSFSRQEKERHSPAEVSDIVNVVLSLIGTALRKDHIDLQVDVPDDLPKLRCRSQQIEQVLLNLLTNARDALNERYPEFDENKILRLTARTRDVDGHPWIRIVVEDHGAGIPYETIDRIFDPFFTTKPRDAGTGLGLSISHGIVRDHRGTLGVESQRGVYTRFTIDLPANNGWTFPSIEAKGDEPHGGQASDR